MSNGLSVCRSELTTGMAVARCCTRYFGTVQELVPPAFGGPPLAHLQFAHPTAAWMKQPIVLPFGCIIEVPGLPQVSTQLARGARLWARPHPTSAPPDLPARQSPPASPNLLSPCLQKAIEAALMDRAVGMSGGLFPPCPSLSGLWEPAELEAADGEGGGRFAVVLHASGRRCVLRGDSVAEHVHAPKGLQGEDVITSSDSESSGSDSDSGAQASGRIERSAAVRPRRAAIIGLSTVRLLAQTTGRRGELAAAPRTASTEVSTSNLLRRRPRRSSSGVGARSLAMAVSPVPWTCGLRCDCLGVVTNLTQGGSHSWHRIETAAQDGLQRVGVGAREGSTGQDSASAGELPVA